MTKVIVYGYDVCPDCIDAIKELKNHNVTFNYMDFAKSTVNLKRFLKLRDSNPEFDNAKQDGNIGIPCFLLSDGTVTLDLHEVLKKLSADIL